MNVLTKTPKLLLGLFWTVLCMSSSLGATFQDTEGHWAEAYIQLAADNHLVSGYEDGNFLPNRQVTGAEFAVMVTNAFYSEELAWQQKHNSSPFWWTPYTDTIDLYVDLVNSFPEIDYFQELSRLETANLVGLTYHHSGARFSETSPMESYHYALGRVAELSDGGLYGNSPYFLALTLDNGMMAGRGDAWFDGYSSLTRGEAAVILVNMMGDGILSSGVLPYEDAVTESLEARAFTSDLSQAFSFRYASYLTEHFDKHNDLMGYGNEEVYLHSANGVVQAKSVLSKQLEDGDLCYYLEQNNQFVVLSDDGFLRTYFLPSAGLDYYLRQT